MRAGDITAVIEIPPNIFSSGAISRVRGAPQEPVVDVMPAKSRNGKYAGYAPELATRMWRADLTSSQRGADEHWEDALSTGAPGRSCQRLTGDPLR